MCYKMKRGPMMGMPIMGMGMAMIGMAMGMMAGMIVGRCMNNRMNSSKKTMRRFGMMNKPDKSNLKKA